jgi:tRNA pseudouridine55 synthase
LKSLSGHPPASPTRERERERSERPERSERLIDGVIVVDKPEGPTSHDVVAVARRVLGEQRIGHTGTLDPLATGVLALACGRATRLVRFLTASTKDYEATVRFGVTTDTFDVTGEETGRSGRRPTATDVEAALGSLRGDYLQTPPAFSAKKVAGRRAYALARQQQPVTPAAVAVRVSRADLVALSGDTATFLLTCSAGFYVRSFAHTLGELVGTGACLAALRRTRSGEFGIAQAIPLTALRVADEDRMPGFVPMHSLLCGLASVCVTGEGRLRIVHGRTIHQEHLVEPNLGLEGLGRATADGEPTTEDTCWVRILDQSGTLVAMARARRPDGALQPAVVLI